MPIVPNSLYRSQNNALPEILAPAHSFSTLLAAAAGGADAVYFGVEEFSLRHDVASFRTEQLVEVVEMAHERGMRAYLATNAVVFESELQDCAALLHSAKAAQIDAVIVQDLGALEIAREFGLEVHVSTQCNICNSRAVHFYERIGARRVVLAREVSLKDIGLLRAQCAAEIEVFVHGAMCIAFSGRCGFSQYFAGRLANRGQCVQNCRRSWHLVDASGASLEFEEGHFFSSKDLCLIGEVPALVATGAISWKIEGRRRPPEYVEVVSRCYKEALQACISGNYTDESVAGWRQQLEQVSNRGFTTGFFHRPADPSDSTMQLPVDRATKRRKRIGVVTRYDFSRREAAAKLIAGEIAVGDMLLITGERTYQRFQLNELTLANVPILRASVGAEVVFMTRDVVNEGDEVWAWVLSSEDDP